MEMVMEMVILRDECSYSRINECNDDGGPGNECDCGAGMLSSIYVYEVFGYDGSMMDSRFIIIHTSEDDEETEFNNDENSEHDIDAISTPLDNVILCMYVCVCVCVNRQ